MHMFHIRIHPIKSCSRVGHDKVLAVHHKTMESYTLWWNGGSLASFLQKLNSKVSEATTFGKYKIY